MVKPCGHSYRTQSREDISWDMQIRSTLHSPLVSNGIERRPQVPRRHNDLTEQGLVRENQVALPVAFNVVRSSRHRFLGRWRTIQDPYIFVVVIILHNQHQSAHARLPEPSSFKIHSTSAAKKTNACMAGISVQALNVQTDACKAMQTAASQRSVYNVNPA